jgi:hypothetical protein
MSASADDLTINYEENGILVVQEVDKAVLSKGAWATVLFRCRDRIPADGSYGPDKYVIQRYKKTGGEYRRQSKFTISSADQARKLIESLQAWLEE